MTNILRVNSALTAERLRTVLSYDPTTGRFYWLQQRGRARVGDEAGYRRPDGRYVVKVDNELHMRYRLAHLYMVGAWPPDEIDHVNCQSSDDRWQNLRPATGVENRNNMPLRSDNLIGLKGVQKAAGHKKWRARYRGKCIGYFDTPHLAHKAYVQAAVAAVGAFARAF